MLPEQPEGEIWQNSILLPAYWRNGWGAIIVPTSSRGGSPKRSKEGHCSTLKQGDDVLRLYTRLGFTEFGEWQEMHEPHQIMLLEWDVKYVDTKCTFLLWHISFYNLVSIEYQNSFLIFGLECNPYTTTKPTFEHSDLPTIFVIRCDETGNFQVPVIRSLILRDVQMGSKYPSIWWCVCHIR